MNRPPRLSLTVQPYLFAVCRLPPESPPPDWASNSRFLSLTRSENELSVVCEQALVPDGVQMEPGWRVLKVAGPLDFNLTGILASLLAPLTRAGISIFALSTFDTDYLLVRQADLERAAAALRRAGFQIHSG